MRDETLQPNRVSFPVADVEVGIERFSEITARSALERTARSVVLTSGQDSLLVVEAGDFHPVIAAAALAYKKHFPLVLSPDQVWLTILQGVAQHVANHSESLRTLLVPHQTKIELVLKTNLTQLPENDAQMMAATKPFMELIGKHVLPDKQFLLNTEFSTTTDLERIVGAVVVMDAFKPYFDYVFSIICGIPSVTLEGTIADWELLGAKVRTLHESDLDISWWTKHLLPLCDQFIRAASGDVDRDHWNNLCKLVERYDVDDLNGWLLKFIPYVRRDRNDVPQRRNPVLDLTEFVPHSESMGKITGCTSNMLPTGLSFAPVTCLNLETGVASAYQFVAGFAGVAQSSADLSLRPVCGWAITQGARIDKLISRLRDEHDVNPPVQLGTESLLRTFENDLPGDLWRFYTETDGARLEFKKTNGNKLSYYIHPANEIKLAIDSRSVERELKHHLNQGIINHGDYEARLRFARAYSSLRVFAESYEGKGHFFYVFGSDPEQFNGETINESRAQIFRWSGEPVGESFEPVAHNFSEWLEAIFELAESDGYE